MIKQSRSKTIGKGLLAGVVAALLMTLTMLIIRSAFGIATPPEMVGDRIATLLSVETFLDLLNRVGGYNQLKQLGIGSVIAGQLIVGALGGIIYAFLVERARQANSANPGNSVTKRRGIVFLLFFVGGLWVLSLILFYPVLGTHYEGLPPERATVATVLGLLLAYLIYGAAVFVIYNLLTNSALLARTAPDQESATPRRAVLVGIAGTAVAVTVGLFLRRFYTLASFSYDGTQYKGKDIQGITPNDRFYVVTKNVVDPRVEPDLWRLEITGMVASPKTYTLAELTALPATTQETTLRCISNQVGDGLMSNAVWKGVPLSKLIEAAQPQAGVVEVLLHGVDNYADTFAFEKAMNPNTLVAYEMNGETLPQKHGYPARIIVSGLYGEKNIKWITRIELVNYDAKGFYEKQGWGPNFVMPTTSRFDQPDGKQDIKLNPSSPVPLSGAAHAGDRGVSRVEVSVDGGKSWQQAKIDYPGTQLSWVLWSYAWQPQQPGEHMLMVRATDGKGELQTAEKRGIVAEGATGYHEIKVKVTA